MATKASEKYRKDGFPRLWACLPGFSAVPALPPKALGRAAGRKNALARVNAFARHWFRSGLFGTRAVAGAAHAPVFRNARLRWTLVSLRIFRNAPVAGRCTRSRFLRNARLRETLERGLFPAWPPFSRRRHRNSVPSFLQKEQNPHPNPNSLIQQDIPFSCKETGKIFADSGRASPSLPRPFSCYASHFYFLIFFVLICFLPILYSRNAFQRSARKRAWGRPFFFLSASSVGGKASRFPISRLSPIGFLGESMRELLTFHFSSVGGEASRFPIPRLSPIGFLGGSMRELLTFHFSLSAEKQAGFLFPAFPQSAFLGGCGRGFFGLQRTSSRPIPSPYPVALSRPSPSVDNSPNFWG